MQQKQGCESLSLTETKELLVELPYYANAKFKEDENIRVRIDGCTTWLESNIVDILENNKYRIRIARLAAAEYSKYIKGEYIRIMDEDEIRKDSKNAEKITQNSCIEKGIIDLYLSGRDCQIQLKVLSDLIFELHNSLNKDSFYNQRRYNIDYMQSRFVSIEILKYCFAAQYHWRLHCFRCKQFGVKMHRFTCRSHVISSGAISSGYFGESLSLIAFCDECNTELDYEDYSFRCENKEHDICLKCVWNKIKQYYTLHNLMSSNVASLDMYSQQCIIEYVVGNIRKFT